jgi:hypothetical protein
MKAVSHPVKKFRVPMATKIQPAPSYKPGPWVMDTTPRLTLKEFFLMACGVLLLAGAVWFVVTVFFFF